MCVVHILLSSSFSWLTTSMVLVGLNLVMCLLMFLLSPTPHEAVRNQKISKVPIIISKLSGKKEDDPEINEEVEKVTQRIKSEVDGMSPIERLKRIEVKNLIILLIVFLMSQLSGITVVTSYNVDPCAVFSGQEAWTCLSSDLFLSWCPGSLLHLERY